MKKFFIEIFVALTVLLMIGSCSPKVTIPIYEEIPYGVVMENAFEGYWTKVQFDSICNADAIEKDLNKWHVVPLRDGETKSNISQYMYIKSLGQNEIIYRLQKISDDNFKITKRITR